MEKTNDITAIKLSRLSATDDSVVEHEVVGAFVSYPAVGDKFFVRVGGVPGFWATSAVTEVSLRDKTFKTKNYKYRYEILRVGK